MSICFRSALTTAGAPWQVHHYAIFCTPPSPSRRPPDWGWGQQDRSLPLANPPTVRMCPRWLKSHGNHRWDRLSHSGSLLLRSLVKQCDCSPGRLLESGRSWWRVAWTILANTTWSWASFMTLSCQSFSTSEAIPAMDTITVRFLWSAAAAALSPILP